MKEVCSRPNCRRLFEPKHNSRKYCSDQCRSLAAYERQDEASRLLWHSLGAVPVSMEIAALNDPDRVTAIILQQAPAGAYGYRVGAPNRFTAEDKQYLRWFPGEEHAWPSIFKIAPFELPRVPAREIYAVAYFNSDGNLLGDPLFKMLIPWGQPKVKWSRGDRKLQLSAKTGRS